MDIAFNCDKCGQHIAIDEAGAGLRVNCPKCGAPLQVPIKEEQLRLPIPQETVLSRRGSETTTDDNGKPLAGPVRNNPVSFLWLAGESSNHFKLTVDSKDSVVLRGRYLTITLLHLNLNISLCNSRTREVQVFTLLELEFHNLWDYILAPSSAYLPRMIDTGGYQHNAGFCSSFDQAVRGKGFVPVNLSYPDRDVEAGAKTRGWFSFDGLPQGIFPHRIVFRCAVYAPGQTSGVVKHYETLEFIIPDWQVIAQTPITAL
jgi:phage FluMu protein Com